MHAGVRFILHRLNADLATAGLGVVSVVGDPGREWGEGMTVFAFGGHETSADPGHVEQAVALLASAFQDDVIDERQGTWPEVGGRPVFPSAESGVACWCLDGRPWCAVGQLADALAATADDAQRPVAGG
jgi:hypothetical protein